MLKKPSDISALHATILFADEIREEINGKLLIVGAYGPDIIIKAEDFGEVPVACLIRLNGPGDFPVNFIKVKFYLDEIEVYDAEIDEADLESFRTEHEIEMIKMRRASSQAINDALLVYGNFVINVPISKEYALLHGKIDIGAGFVDAGTVPVKFIRAEKT